MAQNKNNKIRKNPVATPVKQPQKTGQTPVKDEKPKTMFTLMTKVVLAFILVVAVVKFTDIKGYFNPDYTNDHTRRKWNAFHQFTNDKPVDVVLVGNSHLYTVSIPKTYPVLWELIVLFWLHPVQP